MLSCITFRCVECRERRQFKSKIHNFFVHSTAPEHKANQPLGETPDLSQLRSLLLDKSPAMRLMQSGAGLKENPLLPTSLTVPSFPGAMSPTRSTFPSLGRTSHPSNGQRDSIHSIGSIGSPPHGSFALPGDGLMSPQLNLHVAALGMLNSPTSSFGMD